LVLIPKGKKIEYNGKYAVEAIQKKLTPLKSESKVTNPSPVQTATIRIKF